MNIYRALPREIQFQITQFLPTDESKREVRLQKWRDYYQQNKQKRLEYEKQYRLSNREEILERKQEYRKLRVECICGKSIARNRLSTHFKTKAHQNIAAIAG